MKNEIPPTETIRREHLALAILRLLDRQPGYGANERVLTDYFRQLALTTTSAETRLCLERLERLGLLKSNTIDNIVVVELTKAGQEVANGYVRADGVLRPEPECPY